MLPAIFLLSIIAIVFSQLNNCLSGVAMPLEGSIHDVRCGCIHATSQQAR